MPTIEFQITLDRRELASVLAGLRLLRWSIGPDKRLLPYHVARQVDEMCVAGIDEAEPLSDAEIRELARRLG